MSLATSVPRLLRGFRRKVGGGDAGQGGLAQVGEGACADGAVQTDLRPSRAARLSELQAADA